MKTTSEGLEFARLLMSDVRSARGLKERTRQQKESIMADLDKVETEMSTSPADVDSRFRNVEKLLEREEALQLQLENAQRTLDDEKAEEKQLFPLGGSCGSDHRKERRLYELPTDMKLRHVRDLKQEGNLAVKQQNWGLAAVSYRKALIVLDYTFTDDAEAEKSFDRLKIEIHGNMALVKLKTHGYEEVATHCYQVLKIDPHNVKALYRNGLAMMHQEEFAEAKRLLMEAAVLDPHDPAIQKAIADAVERQKGYLWKSSQRMTLMGKGLRQDWPESTNPEDSGDPDTPVPESVPSISADVGVVRRGDSANPASRMPDSNFQLSMTPEAEQELLELTRTFGKDPPMGSPRIASESESEDFRTRKKDSTAQEWLSLDTMEMELLEDDHRDMLCPEARRILTLDSDSESGCDELSIYRALQQLTFRDGSVFFLGASVKCLLDFCCFQLGVIGSFVFGILQDEGWSLRFGVTTGIACTIVLNFIEISILAIAGFLITRLR
ncbi:MAG: hypothetical protein KVP17_004119 [Porospora cf. gigantea B]|uniref:uncharacterized protein n=1 Tax=Porospora cf. gigantea B TaxID=2853592 RepID=UPI003571BD96|nr:MAG: hypothetical protein KVP17_004119 [Porospora cf. gigantea B]